MCRLENKLLSFGNVQCDLFCYNIYIFLISEMSKNKVVLTNPIIPERNLYTLQDRCACADEL